MVFSFRPLAICLAFVLTFPTPVFGAGTLCAADARAAIESGQTSGSLDRPVRRFPSGMENKEGWHLKIGFESEYALAEAGQLLTVYGPRADILPTAKWQAMADPQQRIQWIDRNRERVMPAATGLDVANGPTKIVKLSTDARDAGLPPHLVLDSTGNLEIVLSPRDTLEDITRDILDINRRFGVGSMQATVSTPADYFFGRSEGAPSANIVETDAGYFRFVNEYDALAKVHLGAQKAARNPDRPSMLPFLHQWLGPVTIDRQMELEDFLRNNSRGQWYEPHRLGLIKGRDGSLKYYGSTVYRPDIAAPFAVATEIRDAHKTWEVLRERIVRAGFHMTHPRDVFQAARGLQAVDLRNDFARLPSSVQTMLPKLFPSKEVPSIPYYEKDRVSLQVYRTFAYPIKNWSGHVEMLADPSLAGRIESAQRNYVNALTDIATRFDSGQLEQRQAGLLAQNALANFDTETGLYLAMQRWYTERVVGTPEYLNYAMSLPPELAQRATRAE